MTKLEEEFYQLRDDNRIFASMYSDKDYTEWLSDNGLSDTVGDNNNELLRDFDRAEAAAINKTL